MTYIFCGNFPELQKRFIRDVTALRLKAPLAPLDVVVPGQLLRLALRRDLVASGCCHANLSFLTLSDLAERAVFHHTTGNPWRVLSDAARGPVLLRAIQNASPLSYFADLSNRDGFRNALWETLKDLRGAGVTGDLCHPAMKRIRVAGDVLPRKLRDLTAILSELEKILKEHRYVDPLRLLELASQYPIETRHPLIVYGVEELNELERRFLRHLARERFVSIYLPYRKSDEFRWVEPLFTALIQSGFSAEFLDACDDSPPVRLMSAAARDREVEALVSDVLFGNDGEPEKRRIGILLRDSAAYVPLLRHEFTQAGVQGYFHQCYSLGETPSGRTFRLFCSLLDERYKRADVTEWFLSSPVKWPRDMAGERPLPPSCALWNHFTISAGITSGVSNWRDGLRRLYNRLEYERRASENNEDDDARLFSAAHAEALKQFMQFVERLFESIRTINRCRTWTEKLSLLWTQFESFVEADENDAIEQELSHAAELDELRIPPSPENVKAFVNTVLERPAARDGRFQVHEPTVATFSEAQGVLFDDVYIPGMVEREIPKPVSQDPLLLDDEREILEECIGRDKCRIPLRKDRRLSEQFAFQSAMTSARGRVIFSFPRRETGGRERLPSSYLLGVLEKLTGNAADYDSLQTYIATDSRATFHPAARLSRLSVKPVSDLGYKLSRLSIAISEASAAPVVDWFAADPVYRRAAAADHARYSDRGFSRYDGVISSPALCKALEQRHHGSPLSPTRMEIYAVCPLRYFILRELDLEPIEEPNELTLISPADRGLLVHDILERFFRDEHANDRIPLQRDALSRLRDVTERAFERFDQNHITGPALLWQIEKNRIRRTLAQLFEHELDDKSGFIPRHFEEPFECSYSPDDRLSFTGKMDRVDIAPNGDARVIDYKTGKPKAGMKPGGINRGRALQLPVYRLAAEAALKSHGADTAYYFLDESGVKDDIRYTDVDWERGKDEFEEAVRTIWNGINGGLFYPYPDRSSCLQCPARIACGTSRMTYKWHWPQSIADNYLALRGEVSDDES